MEQLLIYDNTILNFIQEFFRSPLLDKIMPVITCLGNFGFIWIAVTILALISKRYRKLGFTLALTLILCAIIGNLWLKPFVERLRPFEANHFTELLITAPKDFSFPSGHSVNAVAFYGALLVLAFFYLRRRWLKTLVMLALAAEIVLLPISRVYLGVHYPSDVTAGLLLGLLVMLTATTVVLQPQKLK